MSELRPKAASITAISRLRFASLLFLALFLMGPVRAGLPQSRGVALSSQPASSQTASPPQQQPMDGTESGSGGFDSVNAERRMKMLNDERRKNIVSYSDKLFKLATELNNEIAHSNSGSLTPEQLRKIAEIEKLAHNVRDKMTMTISPPSSSYFPSSGPA